jgi:hypothetical protein
MATWIGHLRIAEKLLPHFPELDPASFAYGSLAPDFGKPLEDGSFFPSKAVSHLVIEIDHRSKIQDLVFYREHLADPAVREDPLRFSFTLGYFIHLVCDGLWGSWIGQACKRDYKDMIAELGVEAWWTMKDDWYGLDVQFAAENPESLFWTVVMGLDDLPLYLEHQDQETVGDQIRRIQKFNANPPQELLERKEFPYLSAATMERFIKEAVQFLLEYYQMIRDERVPEGADSFQDCFPAERFVPYEAPLGEDR